MTDNTNAGVLSDAVRVFSSFLDRGVYGLLNIVYQVFFNITSVDLFQNEVMMRFYGRIQLILGVFMMFQLAMTVLKGIVDPNSFTDSKTGAGNLVYRVATSLILLTVLVPISTPGRNEFEKRVNNNGILFGTLYSLQYRILNNNTIGKLVLGTTDDNSSMISTGNQKNDVEYSSRVFTATILRSFYRINLIEESKRTHVDGKEDEMINANRMCQDIDDATLAAYTKVDAEAGDIVSYVNETCSASGGIVGAVGLGQKRYQFYYMAFVCPIIGIIFVVVFLSFCVDIAIRSVKLAVLRLIAPIPIISYMDPKGGKDNAFSSWVKTLTSTYLDLFIRLAAVYFVLFVIQDMIYSGVRINTSGGMVGAISFIMIWLGLFIFAKQAPKFIKQAIGLKEDAGGGFFSGLGAYAGVLGAIGSFATNWRATDEENKGIPERQGHTIRNLARNFGSGIVGGIAGAATGINAMGGKEPGIKSVLDAQSQRNARRASHSTLPGRLADSAYGMFTGQSLATSGAEQLKANQDAFKAFKDYKTTLEDEALKKKDIFSKIDKKATTGFKSNSYNYQILSAAVERARSSGASTFDYSDGKNTYVGLRTDDFDVNIMNDLKSSQAEDYAHRLMTDATFRNNEGTARNSYISAKKAAADAGYKAFDGEYKTTKTAMGDVKSAATTAETDMRQIMRRANNQQKKS